MQRLGKRPLGDPGRAEREALAGAVAAAVKTVLGHVASGKRPHALQHVLVEMRQCLAYAPMAGVP
jgi:hypothetical protein